MFASTLIISFSQLRDLVNDNKPDSEIRTYLNGKLRNNIYSMDQAMNFNKDGLMKKLGENNEFLELKYSAKIKSLANTAKNYEGKLQGFRRVGLSEKKKAEEKKMQTFLESQPELFNKYGDVIPKVNKLYNEIIKFAPRNLFYDYLYNLSPTFQFAAAVDNYKTSYNQIKGKEEKAAFLSKQIPRLKSLYQRLFAQMDPTIEKPLLVKMFADAKQHNSDNEVNAVIGFYKKNKTDEARLKTIEKFFTKTKILNSTLMMEFLADSSDAVFGLNDDIIKFAHEMNKEVNKYDEQDNPGKTDKFSHARHLFFRCS